MNRLILFAVYTMYATTTFKLQKNTKEIHCMINHIRLLLNRFHIFIGIKFLFWQTQNRISVVSKSEKSKKIRERERKKNILFKAPPCYYEAYYATGALQPTSTGQLFLSEGPVFNLVGTTNNILRGPCHQLLTLLTLKSATYIR